MKPRLLITGANGFVGRALCAESVKQGYMVRAAVRASTTFDIPDCEIVKVDDISTGYDWSEALTNVSVILHLAARVHVMHEDSGSPLAEFRKVNVVGTENLARQAAHAGVKRLVYVSSIKVNGEETTGSQCYSEQDFPVPQDPYGVSKWEAEQALLRVSQETGLEIVIVRPPLVYGPGVKGNFISLLAAVEKGVPLPLAGVENARSLVYVGNLVDALIACATNPAAAGQTYLIGDGDALSTAKLIENIAGALGRRSRLFYFPPVLLRAAATLAGRSAQIDRLLGSLRISDEKIRRELAWIPPYTLEQGLLATAEWYRGQHPR